MPRLLVGLGVALVVAAAIASFSFTATLARVAGVPEGLTWLWPVVVGLTVALIAYTYVTLVGIRYEDVTSLSWFYLLLLVAAAGGSVAGNVTVISRDPTEMDTLEIAAVVSVPPVCLVVCVCNYVVLAAIIPARIASSIRAAGLREWASRSAALDSIPKTFDPSRGTIPQDETPWWKQHEQGQGQGAANPSEGDDPEGRGQDGDAVAEIDPLRSKSTSEQP